MGHTWLRSSVGGGNLSYQGRARPAPRGEAGDFRRVPAPVAARRLELGIVSGHPPENVREAAAGMEAGLQFGKIILTMPS
jgi:hypothetical protein